MTNGEAASGLPPLREIIARFDLGARKSLGQHFLLDLNICRKVVRSAGPLGDDTIVEIGPGPGGLTRALLEAGARKIVAIEKDRRCIAALAEVAEAYPERLEIIEADAMEIDPRTVAPAPRRIIANLPYNVSVPLLMGWLRHAEVFSGFTLMFQKEVADRLTAVPGTKDYGRVSVIAQWLCAVRAAFNLPRESFTPPPKVASTVVNLVPRIPPRTPPSWEAVDAVTRAAFAQRRKMLRGTLKGLGLDLEALGVDPRQRAETLSVDDFLRLALSLESKS